jgi:RNA polymerase sigma factor (sigma-70 family)
MEAQPPEPQSLNPIRQRLQEHCALLSPALFGWAFLRLKGFPKTRIEPEDIVQETWLRALSSLTADPALLAQPEGFRAWLFGIAQNVLLEELRRGRNAPRPSSEGSISWLGLEIDTVTSICTGLARHETVERFLEFADQLDDLDGQLLVRCAFEGVSASDVGRRVGVEPATAIKRWQRLREELQATRLDERLGLKSA